jgi:hypothetical protein
VELTVKPVSMPPVRLTKKIPVCGAPAEKVIYDPLLGNKDGKPWPFYACAKHFTAMAE